MGGLLALGLAAAVGCSGSAPPGIGDAPLPDEVRSGPSVDGAVGAPDASLDDDAAPSDASFADARSDARADASDASSDANVDAGSACNACLARDCAAPLAACMSDPICKVLDECLDACTTSACRNVCFTKYPDPVARAKNGDLFRCQCTTSCPVACAVECR